MFISKLCTLTAICNDKVNRSFLLSIFTWNYCFVCFVIVVVKYNNLFNTLIILCKLHNPTNGSADSEALLLLLDE